MKEDREDFSSDNSEFENFDIDTEIEESESENSESELEDLPEPTRKTTPIPRKEPILERKNQNNQNSPSTSKTKKQNFQQPIFVKENVENRGQGKYNLRTKVNRFKQGNW